jgi:DNA invertase Pin-like site-specific DNA recombinase
MSVAQWEREAIGERTKTALQHKKAQGQRTGSIPYGKQLCADGIHLEENREEQEIIKAVLEFRNASLSMAKIAAQLTAKGYVSRGGGAWHSQTVSNILKAQAA